MKNETTTWDRLNQRQQTYLLKIFERDQAQERAHKLSSSSSQYNNTPAKVWREIEYADTVAGHTRLKQALVDADLVDPGTGSTFKALADRGLIEVEGNFRSGLVRVWLTAKGRKLVRDSQGFQAPKALKTGQLREWHWRALCRAYVCGPAGMASSQDTEDGYGYVSWNTILRLRDYKTGGQDRGLIREWGRSDPPDALSLLITKYGQQFVEEHLEEYRELYPDVPVPAINATVEEK